MGGRVREMIAHIEAQSKTGPMEKP
jgi:hypothetical protein